jgi:hypothetical protein
MPDLKYEYSLGFSDSSKHRLPSVAAALPTTLEGYLEIEKGNETMRTSLVKNKLSYCHNNHFY